LRQILTVKKYTDNSATQFYYDEVKSKALWAHTEFASALIRYTCDIVLKNIYPKHE